MRKYIKVIFILLFISAPLLAFDLGNVLNKVVNEVSNEIKKIPHIPTGNNTKKLENSSDSSSSYENYTSTNSNSYNKISKDEVDLFAYILFDKNKSNLNKETLIDWYFYRHSRDHYKKTKKDEFRYRDELSSYSQKFNKETKKARNYFKNKIFKNEIYVKVEKYDFENERFPIDILTKKVFAHIPGRILVGKRDVQRKKHARLFMTNTKKTFLYIPKSEAREYVSTNKFIKRGSRRYIKGIYTYKISDVKTESPIYNDTFFIQHKYPIPDVIVNAKAIKIELRLPKSNKLLKTFTY